MMRFFYCLYCLIFFFQLSAQELNRSAGDTDKVNTLLLLAGELDYSDPDSSIHLAEHALNLSQKFKWKQGIGRSHHLLGRLLCNKGNYPGSFDHYSEALRIWDEILVHDPLYPLTEKIKTVGNIGVVYQEQGNLTEALVYMFRALKMAEESGNKRHVSQQLSNIGIVYSDLNQLDKSLGYYLRAVKIDEELGNKEGVSATLGNIGEIYDRKGDLARAFVYYSRALKMGEEVGDLDIVSINLGNIGNILAEQGNVEEALEYYYKALKIEEEMGAESGVAFMLGTIGSLYVDLKQFELAENFLKRSIALNEKIGAVKQLVQDEKYISDLYSLTGKPELALDHYKKYIVARDSVFNIEATRKRVSEELEYEFEKKSARQKAAHEKEVLALESEKKLEGQLRMFLFIVIALALLLLFFVHRAYKNKKQHAAHLLEEDNRKQLLLQEVHHRININDQTDRDC